VLLRLLRAPFRRRGTRIPAQGRWHPCLYLRYTLPRDHSSLDPMRRNREVARDW